MQAFKKRIMMKAILLIVLLVPTHCIKHQISEDSDDDAVLVSMQTTTSSRS